MAAIKKVENLDVIISSNGVLIHRTVNTNPEIIVATTPTPEYRFQKKVINIAGDRVQPMPAQAQLTTR